MSEKLLYVLKVYCSCQNIRQARNVFRWAMKLLKDKGEQSYIMAIMPSEAQYRVVGGQVIPPHDFEEAISLAETARPPENSLLWGDPERLALIRELRD